jgi:hypothetical protein
MITILETDSDFICDIKEPCFQMLMPEEAEIVRVGKTQVVLFGRDDTFIRQVAFASCVLFIIDGFEIQDPAYDGIKNNNLRIIKPSEFVGLSAVFTESAFNYFLLP